MLFLGTVCAMILMFSCAISVVKHDNDQFAGIHLGVYSLLRMPLRMFDSKLYAELDADPTALLLVCVFLIAVVFYLVSLFIAQLSCGYHSVYDDMVGYARLERGNIIVEMMPSVPKKRWFKFVEVCEFHKRLEFNPGDIGLSGGLQVLEPQRKNPTNIDIIRRFGGSTSQEMQWPAEDDDQDNENNGFDRIEKLMQKTLQRITETTKQSRSGKKAGLSDSAGHSGSGGIVGSDHEGESASSNNSGAGEDEGLL